MTVERGPLAYRQLRAPSEDCGTLVEPASAEWRQSWQENRQRLAASERHPWVGMSLGELRRSAREQLMADARRHSGQYRTLVTDSSGPRPSSDSDFLAPVVLTGHQPQLFHPGVWFKNFVLAAFARQVSAPAVNLIVDNDTIRSATVRVPRIARASAGSHEGIARAIESSEGETRENGSREGGPVGGGSREFGTRDWGTRGFTSFHEGDSGAWASMVEFDRPGDEVPFEERAVLDVHRFRDFPRAIHAELATESGELLVDSLWPVACDALADTDRLGLCLSRARNVIESQAGVPILDVPLSTVCDAWPFRWFAVGLLEECARFREVHNGVLADYRRAHRIRSRSHPVPELARDGEWHEAPFWVWTTAAPRRRRLFVRTLPGLLELTDRTGWRLPLVRSRDGDAARAVEQLAEARRQGVKLRPRALLTTLFARLLLSDQFVHGIGGAKYDQLTDAIFERFLGMTPPAFITATATLRLPMASPPAANSETHRVVERLRALRFHPESFLSERDLSVEEIGRLVAEKRRWLQTELPRGSRLARHRALGALNEALHQLVRHRESDLLGELAAARRDERRHALLRSREFSYALFPKNWLVNRLLELAAPSS
ncbi:MAG: hypothetical protein RLY70_1090 [Planctomycetota bacterium]